ncbi:MAG: hypothetical protein JKX85_07925, partial [Phycisphaeraceae bacterium]|nr:hypothetical protein [Phycisphaeraceae bacterium]
CLSCHDGSIASDVSGGGMGIGRGFGASGNRGGEHPIGMTYPTTGNKVVSTGSQIAFALPMSLDQRIQLVDGKVSCISCHSPYSKENNLLVMSNDRSKLCLSCHMD